MSVEVYPESLKEYRQRLHKMTTKQLEDYIVYYSASGLNCSGITLNDFTIVPPSKVAREVYQERKDKTPGFVLKEFY